MSVCKVPFLLVPILFALLFTPAGRCSASGEDAVFTPFFTITLSKEPYISMVELAEAFRFGISYDPITLTMTLSRGTQRISVSHLSRKALFNDSSTDLAFPARLIRGAMYVPVNSFLPLLSRMMQTSLSWDGSKNGIVSPRTLSTITNVVLEERAQGTLVRISLAAPLQYKAELNEHNWLTLTLADGALSPCIGFSSPPVGMVLDSRYLQREGEAQISFRISDDLDKYDISRATNTRDLLISIRRKRPAALNLPNTPAKAIEKAMGTSTVNTEDSYLAEDNWRIDTVIIDPGHGGKDSGAVGPKGTMEKDTVLAVAKELKRLFDERRELDAILTRSNDTFISLYQRANIAKRNNGKLFVSIHANASRSHEATGMEVFFLSAAKTADARSVAERENASVSFEDNPAASRRMLNEKGLLNEIQNDMASNVFLKESQDMCTVLLDTTIPVTRQTNRGVKQAGFYVLAGTQAAMPSILFEIGFISNPDEERMLNRVSYQKRLAQSIYDSIITFKERHERGLFSKSE